MGTPTGVAGAARRTGVGAGVGAAPRSPPRVATTAATIASAAPRATTSPRRHESRRGGCGARSAITRTRSRTSRGAVGRASRSSVMRSGCDMDCLLELLERAVEARRAVGGGDAEHIRGGPGVEVEDDAQRDHLALAGREPEHPALELRREAFGDALVDPLRHGGELLAARAASLRAKVVERDRARDLAEPGPLRPALRV